MIPVLWLSLNPETPPRGYWDMGMLEDVFSNKLWSIGYEFVHYENALPEDCSGAVIIFPARAQTGYINELNLLVSKLKWVVLMLTGDEESVFPVEKIKHDNIKIWVMSPRPGRHDAYGKLGTGYPPQINNFKTADAPEKDINWFFAGQVTHQRRIECVEQLDKMENGVLLKTKGFTQGLEHGLYYNNMMRSKVAPAPSGPETPDSFRLFESLELASVPIADSLDPKGVFPADYWTYFFGEEPPFPVLKDYAQLPGYISDCVEKYPSINNKVFSWWISKKRQLASNISQDIQQVSGIEPILEDVTIIIPVSPVKSHPDTSIIDETIQSVRFYFPTAEIILTFDGVRVEQEDRRSDYEEFIRRILWKCNVVYKNVLPLIFDTHTHQVGMARIALEHVKTPIILYVEQDTPLTIDVGVEWKKCIDFINSGEANLIRFHFEAFVPVEHEHMMIADVENGFLRTSQWSQRPHLISKPYFERILRDNFTDNAVCFIEDKMHGVVSEAYIVNKLAGWYQHRLWIYHPEGNIKRSYHTDGRAGEQKWDGSQKW